MYTSTSAWNSNLPRLFDDPAARDRSRFVLFVPSVRPTWFAYACKEDWTHRVVFSSVGAAGTQNCSAGPLPRASNARRFSFRCVTRRGGNGVTEKTTDRYFTRRKKTNKKKNVVISLHVCVTVGSSGHRTAEKSLYDQPDGKRSAAPSKWRWKLNFRF